MRKLVAVLVAAFAATAASASPIVTNGGFETGDFTGWTAVGNTGVVSGVGQPEGNFAARLTLPTSTNPPATAYGGSILSSTFTAGVGSTVSFSYRLQPLPGGTGVGDAGAIRVTLVNALTNATVANILTTTGPNTTTDTGWLNFTSSAFATSGNFRLFFEGGSFDSNNGGILGANVYVDNVQGNLVPIPEPISLVVFGGLIVGGAGLALRRRMAKVTA